ncbi:hypothetical protein BJX62DRAFT_197475 [Aspergillus germanicus]
MSLPSLSKKRLTHREYTVGWICALALELAAAKAMLGEKHAPLPIREGDHNTYQLGAICEHNIVIAYLPAGIYGVTPAAVVVTQMMATFPSIKFGLLVGIGGGVPSAAADIRLGDVVVSKPTDKCAGVVQNDYGKSLANGVFSRVGSLNNPPQVLLRAISDASADHLLHTPSRIMRHLHDIVELDPNLAPAFTYPSSTPDVLFEATYQHVIDPAQPSTCDNCDATRKVVRTPRPTTIAHEGRRETGQVSRRVGDLML